MNSPLADAIVIIPPRAESEGAFFKGLSRDGRQPGLLNAAFLGFDHGIWGSLAPAD